MFNIKDTNNYNSNRSDGQIFADGESGAVWISFLKFLAFIGILGVILSFVFGVVVYPGTIGLRQITVDIPLAPSQGFASKGMAPGYHWNIPFYSKVHIVPQEIQLLHIHRDKDFQSGGLEVQTTDGSSVIVDVSVLSRYYIEPGTDLVDGVTTTHGGPADLIQKLGDSSEHWNNTIRRVAIDELRRALGRLSTSEFYDPQKRQVEVGEAKRNINKKITPLGARIEGIFIRRYIYQEERIDKAIFAKNLQDQEERLNAAASRLAEAQAKSEQVSAEWDAKIETLRVEGFNRAKVVRSEGDLYEAQKVGEGDLVLAKAKAEIDKLRADVYASTAGASNYIAREMAPLLSSLKGGIVDKVDPYDADAWLEKFGIKEKN